MELVNFSLVIGEKTFVSNANVEFECGKVNHILGKRHTGKTFLAKSITGIIPHTGKIIKNGRMSIIADYINIPCDLQLRDVMLLMDKAACSEYVEYIKNELEIENIHPKTFVKNMSESDIKKLKLLYFMSNKPEYIILDDFTLSLDAQSMDLVSNIIKTYAEENNSTVINITQNIIDLKKMKGNNFLLENLNIISGLSKNEIMDRFLRW